jgi:N-methylhydantoinase B/oxoprolinase/acetone carboxylase alpha subunit
VTKDEAQAWLLEEYQHLDPITFQVVRSALTAVCREMGITMMRTAYSPIFVDGMDFSCGILDATGEMIAQGNYCPVHLNSMAYSSQWALMEIGAESLRPGDVVIHNDPYRGGTHITDVNVIKPIFVDGQLIAVACDRAHQIDMGGKARGGFAGDATELLQEGLRIPPVRWYSEGEEVEAVTELILANVRRPEIQRGDFAAQLASCTTAERRIQELARRYGAEVLTDCFAASKDYSERRMRSSIRTMPNGQWTSEDSMDNDGISGDAIRLRCQLTIGNDDLTVDFSGSSPQTVGPVNATYGITASMVFTALLQVSDPDIPANHGCFRPVSIVAPRGTVVNAQFPAPTMGGNTVTAEAIYQVVARALSQAVPESAIAGTHGSQNFTGGGRDWIFYFFTEGGWGARPNADGWDAVFEPSGNCRDYPAEVVELTMPIRYEAVRLRPDLAGAGKYRGGCGTERIITFLEDAEVNSIAERGESRPYGLAGGASAGANALHLVRGGRRLTFPEATGARFPLKFSNQPISKGESVAIVTTGGGGYGDPLERDPRSVLRDVLDEYYSIDDAQALFGVMIQEVAGKLTLDDEGTRIARLGAVRDHGQESARTEPRNLGNPPAPSEIGSRANEHVQELLSRRPDGFCTSECPKGGDPYRCPLWNRQSSDFWSVEVLDGWLAKHCPRRDLFVGVRDATRRY